MSGNFKVHIRSAAQEIEVEPNSTVLAAALDAGINYPFSCKSGRCGNCKSRLHTGEVDHLSHSRFALTEENKAQGLFLACRAVPKSDLEVSWLQETIAEISPRKVKATVISKELFTHDTYHLVLKTLEKFEFYPGQFAMLNLPGLPARSYSMASQPDSDEIHFYIRQIPGGRVSEQGLATLQKDDLLEIEGPFGNSFLEKSHTGPILAVAGGSGIAPVRSIIDGALRNGMRQQIHLYFGVREERDIYLLDYFKQLETQYTNFRFQIAVDRGTSDTRFFSGRVGDLVLQEWPEFLGEWRAYMAGPPLMVEGLTEALLKRNFDLGWMKTDPFYPSP